MHGLCYKILFRNLFLVQFGNYPTLKHQKHAVTVVNQLVVIRRVYNNAQIIFFRHLSHKLVHVALCNNVNTLCRVRKKQNLRIKRKPFTNNNFLLVSAGKVSNGVINGTRYDIQFLNYLLCFLTVLLFRCEKRLSL